MADEQKKCKHCAMMIPKEAKICPFCRKKMPMSRVAALVFIIVVTIVIVWSMAIMPVHTPTTPPAGSDPKTATDAQIYREYELCMQYALKVKSDDKLRGDEMTTNCFTQLSKYGDKRMKKAFATYYDIDYKEKKKK